MRCFHDGMPNPWRAARALPQVLKAFKEAGDAPGGEAALGWTDEQLEGLGLERRTRARILQAVQVRLAALGELLESAG